MGIGEQHPFAGEPVDVRRHDLRLRVVGGAIAVTHVVREDDEDVRFFGAGRVGCDSEDEDG